MVEGAVQKFLKEVTLLGQPFVKNDKQTVEDLLKSKGASVAASRCTSSAKASKKEGRFRGRSDGAGAGWSSVARPANGESGRRAKSKQCRKTHKQPKKRRIKAPIQAHPAQALRRSPDGRRRLRHQPRRRSSASSPKSAKWRRWASKSAVVIGGGNIFRGVAPGAATWTAPPRTTWACSRP